MSLWILEAAKKKIKNRTTLSPILTRKFSKGDIWETAGIPVISDPSSNIAFLATGPAAGGAANSHFFGGIGLKAATVTGPSPKGQYLDVAYYPHYINRDSDASHTEGVFRDIRGIPTGIWEFLSVMADGKAFHGVQFTADDCAYMVIKSFGTDGVRAGFRMDSDDCSGEVVNVLTHPVIVITDHNSGYTLAATCTGMNQYNLIDGNINMTLGLGTNPDAEVTNVTTATFGVGHDFQGYGHSVFVYSFNTDQATAVSRVLAGLTDWEEKLASAEEYWINELTPAQRKWQNVPYEIQYGGLLSIQQIISQEWDGYLTAGVNSWYHNFLRDTGYCAYSLAPVLPNVAKRLVQWFGDATDLTDHNQYYSDKTVTALSYHNTDNAAVFLLAVGKVYQMTGDTIFLAAMETQMNRALQYVQTNYNSIDEHVLANHAHDYWDDYMDHITVADVKYESFIDVLWLAALEIIEPAYEALSDTVRRDFCSSTSIGLRNGLSDYRKSDGSLHYAIKTDDNLYDTVDALPGTLFAAWLLGDEDCSLWVLKYSLQFGPMTSGFPFGTYFSMYSKLAAGGPHHPKDHGWLPHVGIQAVIALQQGYASPIFWLSQQFKTGGIPEYGRSRLEDLGQLSWYSHAVSFPWSHASIVEMVNRYSQFN